MIGYCRVIMVVLTVISLDRVSVLRLVIVRVILVVLTVMSFDRVSVLCMVIVRVIMIVLTVMSLDKVQYCDWLLYGYNGCFDSNIFG